MRKVLLSLCAVAAAAAFSTSAHAALITTVLSTPLTTPANFVGGNSDGTGVWFNPLTGYSEVRGSTFPNPLFEDGKFLLIMDSTFTQTEAEVWTEGLYSRGNSVIDASSSNLNPARFTDGASIGPTSGYKGGSSGYTDLGPTFGNWASGGHGYIGLAIRNAAGSSTSIEYGYAEVNVNPDYSITLLSFAVQTTPGVAITTVSTVPEPVSLSATVLLGAGLLGRRRSR